MCGIVGMAGKIDMKMKDAFADFLTVCQVRGRDATGVMVVNYDDKYDYAKMVGTPDILLDTKGYDKLLGGGLKKVILGHTRLKTLGGNVRKNAHPFAHGDICGVHNGSLRWKHNVEGFKDFEVDSEWVMWHIDRYGIEETVAKFDDTDDAWALVWWDENNKKLNFLRNKDRPLIFCHSEDRETMFWASEAWMFATLERCGIKMHSDEHGNRFAPLPENHLYSFGINHIGKTPAEIFKLSEVIELKAEVRGNTGNAHGSGGGSSHSNVHNIRGGQGAHPFHHGEGLNDDVKDVGSGGGRNVTNLLAQARARRAAMLNLAGSTATPSSSEPSSESTQSSSEQSTASTSSRSTGNRRVLSALGTSGTSRSEDNANTSSASQDCSVSCNNHSKPEKKVSLRKLAGIDYISDKRTNREWPEERFDALTGGKCGYCTEAIGGLEEVHQIFIRKISKNIWEDEVSFVCTSCIIPAIA